jgi:hypothetical protein
LNSASDQKTVKQKSTKPSDSEESTMKKIITIGIAITLCQWAMALPLDGGPDNELDSLGYYYMLTGSQFPNGQTYNGDNASGGTLRFLTDDPGWGHTTGAWQKDDWFPQNSSVALTMKYNSQIQFDNNLIENGDPYGPDNFYNDALCTNPNPTAGLYGGYCMSNNYDWIYAGYFKLTEATTVDTVIGYFDARSGFDPLNALVDYRVNIWSSISYGTYAMPTFTNSFDGDVLCSDNVAGIFSVSDTGVKRHYSGWGAGVDDIIYRVEFQLDAPVTLEAGEYFFSHDATVPEPATMVLLGLGGLLCRKFRKA